MRDLFFAMYGTGLEWTIWCLLFLLIGIVLLIVSLVKLKKKAKIAGIIISALLIWQIVPVGFYWKAWLCRSELPFSVAVNTNPQNYKFNNNYEKTIKHLKAAANTSLIPWQKGAYFCKIAATYGASKQGFKAIEYYNKAYKYIKSYKYKQCWLIAMLIYDVGGKTDVSAKIADELKLYSTESVYLLIQERYSEALKIINKDIKGSAYDYARRACINRALGNRDAELADFQKALSLVKDEKQKKYVMEYKQIRDKELARKKQAAKNMGFVKE